MPRNKRHSTMHGQNFASQIIAMDKLDRKIEETHDKYKSALRTSFIIKIIQSFLALLIPVIAFIPNDNLKYGTALLGAIVGALGGVDLKKRFGHEAGRYKTQYESLVKERYEFIKRQGPYAGMGYSMRVKQVSWRIENIQITESDSQALAMMTPASSSEAIVDENPDLRY